MKKIGIISISLLLLLAVPLFSEAAGMELSVFVPESLYVYDEGSVAITSGLSTSIGMGKFIEIPIGFDYCKLHGLMVEGATVNGAAVTATKPWFIADNFLPYAKLQLNLPIGPVILSAFGGGAASWNATLTPLGSFAADDLAAAGKYAGFSQLSASARFGYGWLAGASFGVNIDPVTISIFGEYRSITSPLEMSATFSTGPAGDLTTQYEVDSTNAALKMRGFAAGIGGSFAF